MIEFQNIKFKNFLSYGNTLAEINFQKNNLTLVRGSNYSGKSGALLDTLSFGLFGVAYRGINKPNLVNSVNGKDCLVEVSFKIGKKEYLVRRGIKPAIFEIFCDGVLIDQDSKTKDYQKFLEQNILKLNYKTFTQLVLLGSANFKPFMQLTAQERRDVIEELLDIRVFSKMNVLVKEKISLLKENLKDIDKDITIFKEKIEIQTSHIKKLQSRNQEFIDRNNEEIQKNQTLMEGLKTEIQQKSDAIEQLRIGFTSKEEVEKKLSSLREMTAGIKLQYSKIEKSIKFYEENNECPTCKQPIDITFKGSVVSQKKEKKEEILSGLELIAAKETKLIESLQLLTEKEQDIQKLNIEISNKFASMEGILKYIFKLQQENKKIVGGDGSTSEEEAKLIEYNNSFNSKLSEKENVLSDREYYDIAYDMLKDSGIKTKIIKQYLPLMNKYINKYLASMDFYVNFNLDENFKEVIKSRYRDEFEYNSFSEGEKCRIDMALLLMFRDIARKKNSTNTNLLILDEILDSSLDIVGSEEFVKLLKALSKKIHIFVISHKSDVQESKFDGLIKVERKGNFSELK